mmetsp:Transcript_42665/g.117708  ORF Transcript_42665/g.117708 Transcript_42665/m.117708 type:complete len:765 (-) Transcript_42665:151-2445(-)|eukprot:CAMPEP_0117536446 /NCGR_PEP_ID=MMETSP0784-20121206/41458_1 /TAXON_ID=39447 /ORGANISM="" /LENGTH=764 /DNA_ID=CAMNT_0005333011 /DNA_START=62 /DNA_END=2356 /DNA_ORIENTATION=+
MDLTSSTRSRPPLLVVVGGPPASGKSTQCRLLCRHAGLAHLSLGDICREYAARDTDVGTQVKQHMDNGNFVPDPLVLNMLRNELSRLHVSRQGCLLDGYPRTAEQAQALLENVEIDKFILLDVPDNLAVERALGRRMDPETGEIYHMTHAPPPAGVLSRLQKRRSDRSEVAVRRRLDVYQIHIDRIARAFEHKLQHVDGRETLGEVFSAIVVCLQALPGWPALPTAAAGADDNDEWDDEETAEEPMANLSLEVSTSKVVGVDDADCQAVITIRVPDYLVRVAVDICCVVDISGSMAACASYEVDGVVTNDGLSCFDIVAHAVKSVIHMLKDEDRLALVAFNETAQTAFALQPMTSGARQDALVALEMLRPSLGTDIWSGLFAGMEALRDPALEGPAHHKTLLLLTDGLDGRHHGKCGGHAGMLRRYKESNPALNFQLNAFGFGYHIDSELLLNLAMEGQGTFAFIPDPLLVGTCFVNCVANVLSTQTQNATLHLTAKGGSEFTGPVIGVPNQMVADTCWGRVVSLGPLQFGQSRDLIVPMRISGGTLPYLDAVVVWKIADNAQGRSFLRASSRNVGRHVAAACARSEMVQAVGEAIMDGDGNMAFLGLSKLLALADRIALDEAANEPDESVIALKSDLQGRAAKALLGAQRFERWGRHYLRALARSHQLQLCTNFMDDGLQVYGGSLFQALRAEGDAIFVSLPAPQHRRSQPAGRVDGGRGRRRAGNPSPAPEATQASRLPYPRPTARAASPDMHTYYGGCGGG